VKLFVGSKAVEAMSYEMPPDDRLLDLSIKPLTQVTSRVLFRCRV
jgi:hypothetical protein